MNLWIASVFTLTVIPLKMVKGLKKVPLSLLTAYISSILVAPELISNDHNFSKNWKI